MDLIENLRSQAELREIEFGEDIVELLLGQRLRAHRFRQYQEMLTESSQRNNRSEQSRSMLHCPPTPCTREESVHERARGQLAGSPWA